MFLSEQSFLFIAVFAHIELTTGNHIGFSKRREKGKEAEEGEEKKKKGKESGKYQKWSLKTCEWHEEE